MNQEQITELNHFFNGIIDVQITSWKRKNICISADYSHLSYGGYVRISFIGNDEERLLLDINIHTGFFDTPKEKEEYRDDFLLIGNKKMKCKRYTICCANNAQSQQVLAVFNAQYQTQFQLEKV